MSDWIKYYYIENRDERPVPEPNRFIEYKNSATPGIGITNTNEYNIWLNYASPVVITEYRYITELEYQKRILAGDARMLAEATDKYNKTLNRIKELEKDA